jgi:hypothetical protein
VEKEFARLRAATISNAEVEESFARAMKTSNSQAEVFNQTMRAAALDMQQAVMPAMLALAPVVTDVTKDLAKFISVIAGDKELEKREKASADQVDSAIVHTQKQLAGQKISSAQIAENKEAQKEAQAVAAAADQDLLNAKAGKMGGLKKGALKAMDYLPFGAIAGWIGGGGIGDGIGHAAIQKEEQDIRAKEFAKENADKNLADIAKFNAQVADLLSKKIVVEVANIDQLKAATSTEASEDGRGKSPEQKAKER